MTTYRRSYLDSLIGLIPVRLLLSLLLAIFVIIFGLWNYGRHRQSVDTGIEREAVRVLKLEMTRLQAGLEEAAPTRNSAWVQEKFTVFSADNHGLIALLIDETRTVIASANHNHIGKLVGVILPVITIAATPFHSN